MVTLGFTYVYWKILGLCPFVFVDNDAVCVSRGGLIYAIILAVIYSGCYLRAVTDRTTFRFSRETPMSIIADFSGLSIEFCLIVSTWFYFGFRQKQAQKILLSFKKIHKTYKELGLCEENAKLLREVKIHTIIMNFIWYYLCTVDHLLLLNCESFKLTTWMPFHLPRVVSRNIMIMFTNTMRAIQQRFSLLNKRIRELPNEISTRIIVRQRCSRKDSNVDEFKSFIAPGPLETYGQIHSDLIDLATIVVEFYSLSILLVMLTHFVQMSSSLYTLCLITKDRTIWTWNDIGLILVFCSWIVLHFSEMAILVYVSDSTAKEANQAGSVLHKMMLGSHADRYIDSAKILSLRLLQRQLSIDLFGLLQMRLSMIHRVIGMVAAYITVMVQLDGQEAREN